MKYIKKVVSSLFILTLLLVEINLSFADVSFFTLSTTPTTTSVAVNISYSGLSPVPATMSVSGSDGYYKEESYQALPSKSVQRTFTGLTPGSQYSLIVYTTDPEKSNNLEYSNNQKFNTPKTTTTTPPVIPTGTNNSNGSTTNNSDGSTTNKSDGSTTNSGVKINSGIKNPLSSSFGDIPSFIKGVLRFFLLIAIPIVTLAIIYTGFLFVTAMGNSEKLKTAKKALIYTLIGAALLLGSLVITDAIQGSVEQIKNKNK